jgi:hypothetical protein
VFLVKQISRSHWRREPREDREGRILAAFGSLGEAELDVEERDRNEWHNHCTSGGFFTLEWTSLPPEILGDLFLDLGIPPCPPETRDNWKDIWFWWKQTAPLLDGVQRERLRKAMDRFSNCRIVTVPVADQGCDAELPDESDLSENELRALRDLLPGLFSNWWDVPASTAIPESEGL